MTRDEFEDTSRRDLALTVRRATADEAEAVAQLINRAYRVEKFFVSGARTSAEEIRELFDQGSFLVLDYLSGELAAAVYLRISRDQSQQSQHASHEAYFGMLAVDPALQGMGLGLRLVSVAEALAEASGCTEMALQVVNLRSELPPWYRSLGYADCGTTPFPTAEKPKQPCHFIRMRKPLGIAA